MRKGKSSSDPSPTLGFQSAGRDGLQIGDPYSETGSARDATLGPVFIEYENKHVSNVAIGRMLIALRSCLIPGPTYAAGKRVSLTS